MNSRFQIPRRVELSYYSDILGVVREFFKKTNWVYASLMSAPEWFEAYAKQAAERMVTGVYAQNARDWRAAAREGMQSVRIYHALQNELRGTVGRRYRGLIAENAHLIQSLPQKVAAQVVAQVAAAERAGKRAEEVSGLALLNHVSRTQAMLIARTEIAKANTALTQARSEELGIQWYVWETSQDGRVRHSHRHMQGVLINFTDPPSPELLVGLKSVGYYQAGGIFNCRCYPAPLLKLSQVKWPHRIYINRHIVTVSLNQFRNINNIPAKAA